MLLDARETLSKLKVEGLVDEARFHDVLARVRHAAEGKESLE